MWPDLYLRKYSDGNETYQIVCGDHKVKLQFDRLDLYNLHRELDHKGHGKMSDMVYKMGIARVKHKIG